MTCLVSTRPVWVGLRPSGFLHHHQIFDVIIELRDYRYEIKNFGCDAESFSGRLKPDMRTVYNCVIYLSATDKGS